MNSMADTGVSWAYRLMGSPLIPSAPNLQPEPAAAPSLRLPHPRPSAYPEPESVMPRHDGGKHGAQRTNEPRNGDDYQELGVAVGHVHGGQPAGVGGKCESVWDVGGVTVGMDGHIYKPCILLITHEEARSRTTEPALRSGGGEGGRDMLVIRGRERGP